MFFYIWHIYLMENWLLIVLYDTYGINLFNFLSNLSTLLNIYFFLFICFVLFFSLTINRFSFQRSAFVCAAFTGAQNQFMTDIRIILETVYFSVFQWHVVRYQCSKRLLICSTKKGLAALFLWQNHCGSCK